MRNAPSINNVFRAFLGPLERHVPRTHDPLPEIVETMVHMPRLRIYEFLQRLGVILLVREA